MPDPSRLPPDSSRGPSPTDASGTDGRSKPPDLLRVALAKTELMMTSADAPLAAFCDVARRLRNQPWCAERVGRALVEAGLSLSFDRGSFEQEEWEHMVGAVSRALFDDQTSLDRVRNFWNHLVMALQE